MSKTNTTRIGLSKATPGTNEPFSLTGFNANLDKIDESVGLVLCTSTSRPTSPFTGMSIFETNTKRTYYWSGTEWVSVSSVYARPFNNGTYFFTILATSLTTIPNFPVNVLVPPGKTLYAEFNVPEAIVPPGSRIDAGFEIDDDRVDSFRMGNGGSSNMTMPIKLTGWFFNNGTTSKTVAVAAKALKVGAGNPSFNAINALASVSLKTVIS